MDKIDEIDEELEKGTSIARICRKYKVSYSTFYRYRQQYFREKQ